MRTDLAFVTVDVASAAEIKLKTQLKLITAKEQTNLANA
jgi:hypothetical protein